MNFLFTTWGVGSGHITPVVAAARKLLMRDHHVRVMSEDWSRPEVESAGLSFVGWKRAPNRQDRSRGTRTLAAGDTLTPQDLLRTVVQDLWCGPSLAYALDVIEELQHDPAHLVVTSEVLFGVMAGCESSSQKFAILSDTISRKPLPGIPPMGPGLAPARSAQERAMHAESAKTYQDVFDSGLPPLNAARTTLGLVPLEHVFDQYNCAQVELLGTSSAFDFPSHQLPSKIRYVGPQIGDPAWAHTWISPWPNSDPRPLVAVGFSTMFQNHAAVVQNVIDALAPLPVRVLVTLGGSIKADELHASDNCLIVESAPHTVVMREAALVVTHGGHGTIMRALVNRLPMLIIPHGSDQNDNAVRITERGAGLSLLPSQANVDAVRAACTRLLNEPQFRASAIRLGDLVAAEAQHSTLVQELEAIAAASAV